jgi:geranylgeranyl transferase type-2 subunit beta
MSGDGFVHRYLKKLRPRVSEWLGTRAERHRQFLLTAYQVEGGFTGRAGPPNPYYTLFGLRAFFLLGEIPPEVARGCASFLRTRDFGQLSPADQFATFFSQCLLRLQIVGKAELFALLNNLRRDDGGFALIPEQPEGSVYATFLVLESLSILGIRWGNGDQPCGLGEGEKVRLLPGRDKIVNFLLGRQREDGGFAEVRSVPFGGTSPTAAALAALRLLGFEDSRVISRACDFLRAQQSPGGGFRAAFAVPSPDLLSTAVALLVLMDCQAVRGVSLGDVTRFVEACEKPAGGFASHPADEEPDVEYTFYGLLVTAICESMRSFPSEFPPTNFGAGPKAPR